ncbi:hypothetical protein [Pseudomonas sp. SJZ131]|uniref:hypothetical protein n=1 Tax=Pseudomonas sp. SJZ131 TaxID=2572895 RepID=UPI00119C3D21|nr:hypothetical protein [Pseudomonas sp. SJZ131]TWD51581.1 hypothetical protein FBY12_0076 [Pseudomonas sp. SJZ131]
MVQPTRTSSTAEIAKNAGAPGKTTKTNQVVVSGSYMEILIGGPYARDKEEHLFGHAALHVFVGGNDFIYDFGRYGRTWGNFDSEGEGVLNVWTSFKTYISGENSLGRVTTGFVYNLDKAKAQAIVAYFDGVIAQKKEIRKKTAAVTRYVLLGDYHPTVNNCTTVTIDGAKISGKPIVQNPSEYSEMRGLSWVERQAARTQKSTQDGIFMPADLQAMLEGNTEARYDKKNIYK